MTADELSDRALGETVTPERLEEAPLEDLESDEQPHHLLRANSIDFGTRGSGDRVYPRMNEYGWVVATDRYLRLVVPHSVDHRSSAVAYEDLVSVDAERLVPKRLTVATDDRTYAVNLVDEAEPGPVAEFARDPSVRDSVAEPAEPTTPGAEGAGRAESIETDGEGHGQSSDPIAKLDRLATLRDRGVLTDDEFAEKKRELLEQV